MKMLTAQLTGLFQRIAKDEEAIEDTARLLAQAAAGEGDVYIAAFGEMAAVAETAVNGAEPLAAAKIWQPGSPVSTVDRVWILAKRNEGDELARQLSDASVPFAMLTAETHDNEGAHVSLTLKMDKGLLPAEDGGRTVFPYAIGALYVWHAVKMAIDEMLDA